MKIGWDASAPGWLDHVGQQGDFGRQHVLDAPMIHRVRLSKARNVLDVGCGEGRFCRQMKALGLKCTGLDPTAQLLDAAKAADPDSQYVLGQAESLPFPDSSFELVVCYLTLIDIEGLTEAVAELNRVLKPGGQILIANLQSYNTAWELETLEKYLDGRVRATIKSYLQPRGNEASWGQIRIINYHRPLSDYMSLFLGTGLTLTHFDEPPATGGDPMRRRRYNNAPWFLMMEWQKK